MLFCETFLEKLSTKCHLKNRFIIKCHLMKRLLTKCHLMKCNLMKCHLMKCNSMKRQRAIQFICPSDKGDNKKKSHPCEIEHSDWKFDWKWRNMGLNHAAFDFKNIELNRESKSSDYWEATHAWEVVSSNPCPGYSMLLILEFICRQVVLAKKCRYLFFGKYLVVKLFVTLWIWCLKNYTLIL